MVDTSSLTNGLISLFSSSLTWVIVFVVVMIAAFGGLWIRKRRKLEYIVHVHTNLGNGKEAIRVTKAGWFKTKWTLFGLWDYGQETQLMLADGRKVLAGSLQDIIEIDGKLGLNVYRKEDDPKIVVPISKVQVEGKKLLMTIAPADYRDAATEIVNSAVKETQTTMDRILPVIMYGIVIVMSLIVILLVIQFANRQVDKAGEILLKVAQAVNVQPSRILNSTAP